MKRISIYNSYVKDNRLKRENIANQLRAEGFYTGGNGDLMLVIGGDGTFLSAVKKKIEENPVFVVLNAGNLGFFSEFDVEDVDKLVSILKRKQYFIEELPLYEVHLHSKEGVQVEYFINEVKISQKDEQVIHMVLEVDGQVLFKTPADNMIISGIVGSTAHNLTAGGPLSFCPDVLNVVTTNHVMNAAYPYAYYPAIIPNDKPITVFPSTQKQRPFKIVCDSVRIDDEDINYRYITIKKHKNPLRILRTNQYSRVKQIHSALINFDKKS